MNPWEILGFGAVAVDDLLYVDHYPPPDTKQPGRERRREGGGLAGTALVAAACLGARTAYCGVLGDDDLSRFTIEALEREGVDCSPVLRRAGARPFHSTIIVDRGTGQRSILFDAAGVTAPPPEAIRPEWFAGCRVVFVDHTVVESAARAIECAHAAGAVVLADVERDTGPLLPEVIRQVDHLVVGARMGGILTGAAEPPDMVRLVSDPGRACAVVTAGERGCWYSERGEPVRDFPAFPVRAVDTTGCGDVFHGAYAACLARGEGVAQAIRVATAAAGIKATRPGGRSGIPGMGEVEAVLAGQPGR